MSDLHLWKKCGHVYRQRETMPGVAGGPTMLITHTCNRFRGDAQANGCSRADCPVLDLSTEKEPEQ